MLKEAIKVIFEQISERYKEIGLLVVKVSRMISEGKVSFAFYAAFFLAIVFLVLGILIYRKRAYLLSRVGRHSKLTDECRKMQIDSALDQIDSVDISLFVGSLALFLGSFYLFGELGDLIFLFLILVILPLVFFVNLARFVYIRIVDFFDAFERLEGFTEKMKKKEDEAEMKKYNGDWKLIEGKLDFERIEQLPDCLEKTHLVEIIERLKKECFDPFTFYVHEYPKEGVYICCQEGQENYFCIQEVDCSLIPHYTTIKTDVVTGFNHFSCSTIRESIEKMEC
ncbi:hypothetical protein [Carnobacterium maltaromaticum]|uniref:hypothetical protein n=1 Tax=Carnobacterium maltaromaticum TaxID=2751 RepID=UPI001E5D5A25|nr:hypothetical protein [Carnobacterium maltaromaticum]